MKSLLSWCRHLWMALGLRGRLVAGYTALFAVLLLGIALGETTLVRQVLIDDREAALPGAMNDLTPFLGQTAGGQGLVGLSVNGSVLGYEGSLPAVTGNSEMVLALLSADGSVLSRAAGSDVRNVDPRQLLDARDAGGDSDAPTTYQRTIGATTYLVQVRTISMTVTVQPGPTQLSVGSPPPLGAVQTAGGVRTMGAVGATRVTVLVAESLRSVDDTVHTLLLITLTASALGLVLAATIGLVVARHTLRPLERMTATAQAIAAGGDGALDRRLRLPAHGDEVGRLARTFDQMLDRIQDTIAERVRSETRLRHFAADASHELRTPLAAVSGYTEVLLLGGKDDPATTAHVLRQMNGELARMNRLVGDLLTLARLEAGLPLHVQALPIVPLLEGLVEETRLLAARSGRALIFAELKTDAADGLAVLADPDRLHQILLNLLHNAVKFTPDGGCISVGAARQNGRVALSVTDTGPGIAAAELPLLFERFYRGDKARARGGDTQAGGAGLGLAIAQGLALAQGGQMDVASTPGVGSTFTVILPAAPDESGDLAIP
ncbi:MAG TPA: ATP-binding protein [Chloroflexota bacterium]|nr:ATP-binding protein [Chloroflexota bacterium]